MISPTPASLRAVVSGLNTVCRIGTEPRSAWATRSEASSLSTPGSWASFIYFSQVTMFTIGYGDMVPLTALGRLFAGLVPVFGVFWFHWEVFPLMFLFWSENVLIGLFNVLKMLTASPEMLMRE